MGEGQAKWKAQKGEMGGGGGMGGKMGTLNRDAGRGVGAGRRRKK